MDKELEEAFSEVDAILKLTPAELTKKIPIQFLKTIEENKSKDYKVDIKEPIDNNNLKHETKIILGLIYRDFLVDPEEREELNKTRNLFINAMAHEMKTPNAVILNSTEMLIENVNPEKQHKYLRMIEDESKHMNNLLNQMLIYTRTIYAHESRKQLG